MIKNKLVFEDFQQCPLSLIVKQGLGKTQPLERNQ